MLQEIQDKITAAAAAYGVSPALAVAVVQTESAGDPGARSGAGAQGLFQLMPRTAAAYGVADPFDVDQNIDGGVRMLADLGRQYGGDLDSILAAYNWGSGNLASGRALPTETVNYIARIRALLGGEDSGGDTGGVALAAVGPLAAAGGLVDTLPDWALETALGAGAAAMVWLLVRALRR